MVLRNGTQENPSGITNLGEGLPIALGQGGTPQPGQPLLIF
jgi:hypothetical protein